MRNSKVNELNREIELLSNIQNKGVIYMPLSLEHFGPLFQRAVQSWKKKKILMVSFS